MNKIKKNAILFYEFYESHDQDHSILFYGPPPIHPLHQNQNGLVEIFFWATITEISVKNSCFQLLAAVTAKQTAQLVQ